MKFIFSAIPATVSSFPLFDPKQAYMDSKRGTALADYSPSFGYTSDYGTYDSEIGSKIESGARYKKVNDEHRYNSGKEINVGPGYDTGAAIDSNSGFDFENDSKKSLVSSIKARSGIGSGIGFDTGFNIGSGIGAGAGTGSNLGSGLGSGVEFNTGVNAGNKIGSGVGAGTEFKIGSGFGGFLGY